MTDRPALNEISQNTLDFAQHLLHRALGNADDQRWCEGTPHRNYAYGILFSHLEAENSRRGDRTDIRPNAMSVRFEVEDRAEPLKLSITPSFWVYYRRTGDHLPADDVGDLWSEEVVWTPWDQRLPPTGSGQLGEAVEEGARPTYVRARYCQMFDITLGVGQRIRQSIPLDFEPFRNSRSRLGSAPVWEGEIQVFTDRTGNGDFSVRISLVNTYRGSYVDPSWFDVRMRVRHSHPLKETFCPLLDARVPVQTVNCVLADGEEPSENTFEVEQVNLAARVRQTMRLAVAFEDANWQSVAASVQDFANEATVDHRDRLRQSVETVGGDQRAVRAMEIVLEAFRRAMQVRVPGGAWFRHQLAILVLGAAEYLTGAETLNPLVLNVPTAGGKTEAFSALALWTVAYEALQSEPRWGTAIIKYPTKLLSSDQAERLSHYVMHFDGVLADYTNGQERPRGLGLFFGSDREEIDRLEVIGEQCPECGQRRQLQPTSGERQPRMVVCDNGHEVLVALQDEIYPLPPTLIVGTIDKFVSKNRKSEMKALLGGGPIYWCPEQEWYVIRSRCYDPDHDNRLVQRRGRLTTLILDEAHLLREEVGSLDSHFETLYLENARELSGRYPLSIVSTATIAQAAEHCRQLGLGPPLLFPGRGRENFPVYYDQDPTRIQHVVLSLMPRGRAIAWALPQLLIEYLKLHNQAEGGGVLGWQHLKPTLIYCGSYTTRNQTQNSIRRHVDPAVGRTTEIGEFSRRRFNQAGMRREVEQIQEKDVIISTNIASVGIDLGDLNAIFYFGMPYNVNEFIQSMNRTGRQQPALVCIVHNPYLERDAAFYAYMRPFLARPEGLVEAVPLNRYARRAIDHTFSTVAISQLQNVWGPRMPDNVDLRRARRYGRFKGLGFREARGRILRENEVLDLLHRTYRSEGDPSESYPEQVRRHWDGMASAITNYTPQGRGRPDFPYGDNWIWYADGVPDTMWQLRLPDPMGVIDYTEEARRLRSANISVIYGSDRDEAESIREEEADIQDGALSDSPPDGGEGDE